MTPFCGDTAKIGISCQISQNSLDLSWPTLQVSYAYWWGRLSCYSFGRQRVVSMATS